MSEIRTDIRTLSLEELTEALTAMGEKAFRARQIYEWLWVHSCTDLDQMTNLSKALREKLKERFDLAHLEESSRQISSDGTVKLGFRLSDDRLIEGVLIPTSERATACISSQVGCTLQCAFCATGLLKRERNLEAAEIYDQVVHLNRISEETQGRPLSNIVLMGMGEPLLNLDNVLAGIDRITAENGLNMSPSRITLSTVGIARQIRRLGDLKVKFNLALSLHAATDERRIGIMPINKSNPIDELMDALNHFYRETRNKITFEYILLDGVNDSEEDARALVQLQRRVPSFINLIEYNAVEGIDFRKTPVKRRERFIHQEIPPLPEPAPPRHHAEHYLQIARNRDLTVTPRFYTEVLPSISANYRNLAAEGAFQVGGMVTYGTRRDPLPGGGFTTNGNKDVRGYVEANGRFQFTPNWSLSGSGRLSTDDTFLRRYDISRDDRLRSTVSAERVGVNSYFSLAGWAVQDLRITSDAGQQPIVLPVVDYRLRMNENVVGGTIRLQANTLGIVRTGGQDTQRAFASAEWSLSRITTMG